MGWRRSGREREEREEARVGRAEGWKEGPEEEPGQQESPRWARSTLGRSPRRRGRSLTKGLEPSFLGLLPSLLSISAAPSPCLRLPHTKAKCPPSSEAIAAVALGARPSCAFSARAAHSRAPLCDPPAASDRPCAPWPLAPGTQVCPAGRRRIATGGGKRGSAAQAGGRARSSRPPLPRWPVYLDAVRRLIIGDQHVPVSAAGWVPGSQLRGEG